MRLRSNKRGNTRSKPAPKKLLGRRPRISVLVLKSCTNSTNPVFADTSRGTRDSLLLLMANATRILEKNVIITHYAQAAYTNTHTRTNKYSTQIHTQIYTPWWHRSENHMTLSIHLGRRSSSSARKAQNTFSSQQTGMCTLTEQCIALSNAGN